MKAVWTFAGVFALLLGAVAQEEEPDQEQPEKEKPGQEEKKTFDKDKHPWTKWKPGTSVTRTTERTGGMGGGTETEIYKLKEIGEGEYTIEITKKDDAGDETSEKTTPMPEFVEKATLTVGDTEHECEVWTWPDAGPGSESKLWINGDGKVVQFSAAGATGEKVLMKADDLDAEVEVEGKTYSCVKLKGSMPAGTGEAKISIWFSNDIPGGIARFEMKLESDQFSFEQTQKVTKIEIKE